MHSIAQSIISTFVVVPSLSLTFSTASKPIMQELFSEEHTHWLDCVSIMLLSSVGLGTLLAINYIFNHVERKLNRALMMPIMYRNWSDYYNVETSLLPLTVITSATFNGSFAVGTGSFSAVIRALQTHSPAFKKNASQIATFITTLLLSEGIITAGQSNCCFMISFVRLCWNVPSRIWLLFCIQSCCVPTQMLLNYVAWGKKYVNMLQQKSKLSKGDKE